MLIVMVYFLRGTFLPWRLPLPYTAWVVANVAALTLSVLLTVYAGGRWRSPWVVVIVCFAASVFAAEQFRTAALHWVGLTLLMLGVGPVISNPLAFQVRKAAWEFTVAGIIFLTSIFIVWYALRLPSFGVGFSAFMNQCMLLGPIVGLGAIVSLARLLHGRSRLWSVLAGLAIFPLLASGSRVAVVATGSALSFLVIRRKPVAGALLGLGFAAAILAFVVGKPTFGGGEEGDKLTSAISRKGVQNSRADLWQSRMEEFRSSPLIGIGVAMGTGSGAELSEKGEIRVEPGSAYLGLLAMTGVAGSVSLLSAVGVLVKDFARRRKQGVEDDILVAVGIFFAVHGLAEGWILGFGSPLCFLFWLWMGTFGDAPLQSVAVPSEQRLPGLLRMRQSRPARPAVLPLRQAIKGR